MTYTKTATAIGDDDNVIINLARSKGFDAGHDVIVHGDQGQFITNNMPTSAQQIADAVLQDPDYLPGQPINLATCDGAEQSGLWQEKLN